MEDFIKQLIAIVTVVTPIVLAYLKMHKNDRDKDNKWKNAIESKLSKVDSKVESVSTSLEHKLELFRKDFIAKLDGLSNDIEGNTKHILQVQEAQRKHEDNCKDRWKQNWSEHRDLNTRLSKLEGSKES